jgi:hypothetical protein
MDNFEVVLDLRHTLATLAYRAAKALRDAPEGFAAYRPAEGSRAAGEILAHLGDLMDWALSMAQGDEKWHELKPGTWIEDSERFFAALTALDVYIASGAKLHASPDRLFQGAIADALTHVGQINMLRRLAGARVRAENYSRADIKPGRTKAEQAPPAAEYGK